MARRAQTEGRVDEARKEDEREWENEAEKRETRKGAGSQLAALLLLRRLCASDSSRSRTGSSSSARASAEPCSARTSSIREWMNDLITCARDTRGLAMRAPQRHRPSGRARQRAARALAQRREPRAMNGAERAEEWFKQKNRLLS
eukprot:6203336-Pleurochrysis_carterae.AAC.2